MKHFSKPISVFLILTALAAAQSLGDAAREARKNKRPASTSTRVFTNESVAGTGTSVNSTGADALDANLGIVKKDPADKAAAKTDAAAAGAADLSPEEQKAKLIDDTRKELDASKASLAQMQRDLEVTQRENRLRAASYYGDAGNRLRDEKKYADEDRKNQADLASKQQAIAGLQRKVDALAEQLRRLGAR